MRRFSFRQRPLHLGKYPMEKIKRVEQPTTRITDQVPRVPQRANFFTRARFGDLGPKPKSELPRFVLKYPLSVAMGEMMRSQIPLHDGQVALDVAPLPDDPGELSEHIKALCYFLDADVVGICRVPEYVWYSHDLQGNPIEPRHKYAVVLLIDQGFETMDASSGDDWISGAQSYRAYLKGSTIACTVAGYLRQLGYEARAHTNADSQVLHLPLTLLAGLGELSRIGELVLNPFLGPRFKTSVVTTNLPLAVDKPIDFGLQDFCRKCMKCARECPCGAISFGDKVMFNGYEMWKPDVEACVRYRVTNPGGSACGRCMKVCPFNKPSRGLYRLALWLAVGVPALRRFFIWLDDALEYGQRNPLWKWWLDLEWRDGKLVRPAKTNQRDLHPRRPIPLKQKIALYPAEVNPPPASKQAHPVNRRAAQARSVEGGNSRELS
ncbi:MAG: reductive dehalogenase, partial [Anaerolineae bacterium]